MGNSERRAGEQESESVYKFILDNKHYVDISYLGVLKILFKNHKIHKSEYKQAIRSFINKKPLPNSIYSKIHFYLHTRKARTSKNTLIAITKKQQAQNKRFISVEYSNNQNYAVFLKKRKFLQYVNNQRLNEEYKRLMLIAIQKEFNHKIERENAISGGDIESV
jgi:hypothetical protein